MACEECTSPGELTGGTIEVNPPVACLDDTITFTISGVTDSGGMKRTDCTRELWIPGVPPTYTWVIIKPDGTTVPSPSEGPGEGPVATVLADEPGTYSCTFSASVSRDCAPENPVDIGPETAKAIELKISALTFDSDHGLMRDNNTDFEPTGDPFDQPEWGPAYDPPRNYPISHTMGEHVEVSLIVTILPVDTPELSFDITASAGIDGFTFSGTRTLDGGLNFPTFTSTDTIESRIQELSPLVEWSFAHQGAVCEAVTGPHTVYVTMGTPRDTYQLKHVVTQKRMERAVEQAAAADSLNPHEIVKTVNQAQPFNPDSAPENAWTVPDDTGDCQSIVRFTQKVIKQVGCPATLDRVAIYAIETAPTDAIEQDAEVPPCCGFNVDHREHPTNPEWELSLIAGGLCNAFEAAAKFTFCEETRYYPGGTTNVYEDADQVLYVFDTMSWIVSRDLPACSAAPEPPVFEYTPKPPDATIPDCP